MIGQEIMWTLKGVTRFGVIDSVDEWHKGYLVETRNGDVVFVSSAIVTGIL